MAEGADRQDAQKLNLEVNLDLAKGSIKSLKDELRKLNIRFDSLVPNEAKIQAYEGNINVASQEYLEILKKFNQTNMAYSSSGQIKQIEMAMPGSPQPSKKMLLVAVSGVGSFVLCLLVLFILFYLDNSIQIAEELANKTNIPVLGFLPIINDAPLLSLNQLWELGNLDPRTKEFKNQLRSVRFEIEQEMAGAKLLVVTSLNSLEGKTFLAMSLASAYIMVNKKVLLIDGNFNDSAITQLAKPASYIEDVFNNRAYVPRPGYSNDVTILGNRGMDISLFEISTEESVKQKLEEIKEIFDVIIVESSSLNTLNQSKEWISVADKVISVFEANKTITPEEKLFIAYLKSLNQKFLGWVLNKSTNEFGGTRNNKRFFRKNNR